MSKELKGRGSTYSRHHRGETPPGTHSGNSGVNQHQKQIDKAKLNIGLKPKPKNATGELEPCQKRLSKGARRTVRIAKGFLRKNGLLPS